MGRIKASFQLHLVVGGLAVSSSGGRLTVASTAASCCGVYGVELRRLLRRRATKATEVLRLLGNIQLVGVTRASPPIATGAGTVAGGRRWNVQGGTLIRKTQNPAPQ